jgi:ABC-type sugar transport system ATPase subunit
VTVLEVDALAKAYAGVPALKRASLAVRAGEVHALMGENGAGKSTLIRILAGATRADSGEIRLAGKPVAIASPADADRHGLRFIHQELNLVPQLSVAENIFLGRPYPLRLGAFVDWTTLNARAAETLFALGLSHIDPARKMARLSTGDQMLVKIAAAFLETSGTDAMVYVMDEPTAALTDAESARLFRAVGELTARGRSVIYVSHRMDEVMEIADRVTVMRDGETVATAEIAETSKTEIIEWMTGRAIEDAYPKRREPIASAVALEVRGLGSDHLDDFDLDLREGEIVGLAGLSGSGQSEVLRLLIGAERPGRGTVMLCGRQIKPDEPAGHWPEAIAYVPRERRREGLLPYASVADNTVLPHLAALSRLGIFADRQAELTRTAALAGRVRLKSSGPRQPVRQLSGGNQQKVVFARAILGAPKLLLLDEPTRGVDVGAKFDIYTLLRELAAQGTSILLSSSDLPELLGLCDRILVLRDGRVAAEIETAGLDQQGLLALIFGAGPATNS